MKFKIKLISVNDFDLIKLRFILKVAHLGEVLQTRTNKERSEWTQGSRVLQLREGDGGNNDEAPLNGQTSF